MIEVAGILLIQGDEYILQHRDEMPTIAEPGTYSLWGGTLESGEKPEAGALRELKEETGLALDPGQIRQLYSYESVGKGPKSFGKPVRAHLFIAEIDAETVVNFYEGQGIVRLPKYDKPHPNLNEFAKQAIEIYETAAR